MWFCNLVRFFLQFYCNSSENLNFSFSNYLHFNFLGLGLNSFSKWFSRMHLKCLYALFDVIRFVNLMDGHIWIESEGLGKGCTASFIVKLGFPDRPNESKLHFVPKVQANHVQTNFTGLKVLVMDENGLVMQQNSKFHFF